MEPGLTAREAIEAARSTDVVDFGRLSKACVALVHACDAAGDDASVEQQEALLRSYQGILAWRAELERAVSRVDGAIDIAAAKVRAAL